MDNNYVNQLIKNSKKIVDDIAIKYNYPSNITHLLYLILPAFIIKYGNNHERYLIDSFKKIPIIIDDKGDKIYQAYYTAVPFLSDDKYITRKAIVLKNYHNIGLMQLIDNLVHEINHAINSINQEVKEDNDKLSIRTGLTWSIYDKKILKPIGKDNNAILEEIINTKQTETIVDIINSFSNYEINDTEVSNTIYAIQHSIDKNYRSKSYFLQSQICKELTNNKTFISTLENLRFKGDVHDIEYWFNSITGVDDSYKRLATILADTLKLQVDITNKKGLKFLKINKIRKLNDEAKKIVKLFSQNCNYR